MIEINVVPDESIPKVDQNIKLNGQTIYLPRREAELFDFLLRNRGQFFTVRELYEALFAGRREHKSSPSNIIGNVINKIRERGVTVIVNEHGRGYSIPA